MPETPLTGKQIRFLRAHAHRLKPIIIIGSERCSAGVIQHVDQALEQHELIKVRLTDAEKREVLEAEATLAAGTHCIIAQRIGHTLVLYRERREGKPTLRLPA